MYVFGLPTMKALDDQRGRDDRDRRHGAGRRAPNIPDARDTQAQPRAGSSSAQARTTSSDALAATTRSRTASVTLEQHQLGGSRSLIAARSDVTHGCHELLEGIKTIVFPLEPGLASRRMWPVRRPLPPRSCAARVCVGPAPPGGRRPPGSATYRSQRTTSADWLGCSIDGLPEARGVPRAGPVAANVPHDDHGRRRPHRPGASACARMPPAINRQSIDEARTLTRCPGALGAGAGDDPGSEPDSEQRADAVGSGSGADLHRARGRRARLGRRRGPYLDFPMALGPVLLRYRNLAVDRAIVEQLRSGITFTLSHPLELEVASRLLSRSWRRAGQVRQDRL